MMKSSCRRSTTPSTPASATSISTAAICAYASLWLNGVTIPVTETGASPTEDRNRSLGAQDNALLLGPSVMRPRSFRHGCVRDGRRTEFRHGTNLRGLGVELGAIDRCFGDLHLLRLGFVLPERVAEGIVLLLE